MSKKRFIPESDLENLGNLISYLIVQRDLGKPVTKLKEILRDLRLTILSIISSYYKPNSADSNYFFMQEVRDFLADLHDEVKGDNFDEEYFKYCINEIRQTFENADQIKSANPSKRGRLLNVLILKSFDFKLKPLIRLIKTDSKRETFSA